MAVILFNHITSIQGQWYIQFCKEKKSCFLPHALVLYWYSVFADNHSPAIEVGIEKEKNDNRTSLVGILFCAL